MRLGRIIFGPSKQQEEASTAMRAMFSAGYKAVATQNDYENLLRRVLVEWRDKSGEDDPWDVERWTQTIRDIEAALDARLSE